MVKRENAKLFIGIGIFFFFLFGIECCLEGPTLFHKTEKYGKDKNLNSQTYVSAEIAKIYGDYTSKPHRVLEYLTWGTDIYYAVRTVDGSLVTVRTRDDSLMEQMKRDGIIRIRGRLTEMPSQEKEEFRAAVYGLEQKEAINSDTCIDVSDSRVHRAAVMGMYLGIAVLAVGCGCAALRKTK